MLLKTCVLPLPNDTVYESLPVFCGAINFMARLIKSLRNQRDEKPLFVINQTFYFSWSLLV